MSVQGLPDVSLFSERGKVSSSAIICLTVSRLLFSSTLSTAPISTNPISTPPILTFSSLTHSSTVIVLPL